MISSNSDALDDNALGIRRKRFEVIRIGRKHRSTWLGHRHQERVDRRTTARPPPKQRRSSRDALRDPIDHVAGLEQSVLVRVSPGMPLKAFDEDDGRNRRRP